MGGAVDVVVVGSGIGGSALARALALGGLEVLVLERESTYRDKVRGENMPPWGVLEVKRLGIEQILLSAGGHYIERFTPYDEVFEPAEAEARSARVSKLLPGAPGFMGIGHPDACGALSAAAARAGAQVLRGITEVRVTAGPEPSVTFRHDGVAKEVSCRLVVGADGRNSVVREQLGFVLEQTETRTLAAGLLVEGFTEWPNGTTAIGTAGDLHYLVCPRSGGTVRLFLLWSPEGSPESRARFAGPNGARAFLQAFRFPALPFGDAIAACEPAGPCATLPMNDSWIDVPYMQGAVLMGDAAGWNDPIIGQGLSIALRDARILSELLLAHGLDRIPAEFAPYADERRERMRRLRVTAQVVTDIRCTFGPEGAARRRRWFDASVRDPLVQVTSVCPLIGPDKLPAEGFGKAAIERILSL